MSESGTGGHPYKSYKHHCIGLYVFYQSLFFLSELFTLGTLPASKVGLNSSLVEFKRSMNLLDFSQNVYLSGLPVSFLCAWNGSFI